MSCVGLTRKRTLCKNKPKIGLYCHIHRKEITWCILPTDIIKKILILDEELIVKGRLLSKFYKVYLHSFYLDCIKLKPPKLTEILNFYELHRAKHKCNITLIFCDSMRGEYTISKSENQPLSILFSDLTLRNSKKISIKDMKTKLTNNELKLIEFSCRFQCHVIENKASISDIIKFRVEAQKAFSQSN